ncbi:P-loop containing nucleoside triphosphate hydrolase protein [Phaeosphaeriaceae sp. PMI808]|nr:P-loop containing nucleoside triphosphate hydrolase protein [Phaeosphaeriaceae sp. PMI808]
MLRIEPTTVPAFSSHVLEVSGWKGAGKSELITKFTECLFKEKLFVDGKPSDLRIQETNGLESDGIEESNGFLIVYDVSNVESFSFVKTQLAQMRNSSSPIPEPAPHNVNGCVNSGNPVMLVGNKCDISTRKVTTDEGRNLASELKLGFWETSAKDGTNVQPAFFEIIREMRKHEKGAPLHASVSRDCSKCIVS